MRGFSRFLHFLQAWTISGRYQQCKEKQVTERNCEQIRKNRRRWSDRYNAITLIIAAVAVIACSVLKGAPIWLVIVLVAYRLFEIAVNQLSVLFETDREFALIEVKTEDSRRLLLVALLNYLETILWYALLYGLLNTHFKTACVSLNSVAVTIYFSLVTMTTLGYGDITPMDDSAAILVSTHLLMGILLTLLILARFIGALQGTSSQKPVR